MEGLMKRPRKPVEQPIDSSEAGAENAPPKPVNQQPDSGGQPEGLMARPGEKPEATEQMPADEDDYENDPQFQQVMEVVKAGLYEKGAADNVNRAMKSSPNPVETMATLAYEFADQAIETAGDQLAPELIVPVAVETLQEMYDIGMVSTKNISEQDLATAVRLMAQRLAGELGLDTRELDAAMGQVSSDQVMEIAGGLGNG